MKLNRRMARSLADLRSRNVGAEVALPGAAPGAGPKVQIVEASGCYLLGGFVKRPHLSPADFPDQTNLECSANRLRMEAMLDPRLATTAPLLLLTAGLVTARAIAHELAGHAGRFNVIVSYDGESCTLRFHKVRKGQRWLAEDLEDYVDEGVLVVEAGGDLPWPAALPG